MADSSSTVEREEMRAECQRYLTSFRVLELKELLKQCGQSTKGRKTDLFQRANDMLQFGSPKIQSKIREIYDKSTNARRQLNYGRSAAQKVVSPAKGSNGGSSVKSGSRAYVVHPDVKFKNHPFFSKLETIIRPTALVSSGVAGHGSMSMRLKFHLTPQQINQIYVSKTSTGSYQTQILVRFCLQETTCDQNDYYPKQCYVKVNGHNCPIPGYHPHLSTRPDYKRNGQPVNITNCVKTSPAEINEVVVYWAHDIMVPQGYCVGVEVSKVVSSSDLLQSLKAKGVRSPDMSRALVKDKFSVDKDCEVAATSIKVSLLCPIGKMRMSYPCRTTGCTHLQCFDANIFFQMNEKRARWVCPVCDKQALPELLFIDGLFMEICQKSPSSDSIIEFNEDGSWKPATETSSSCLNVDTPEKRGNSPITLDSSSEGGGKKKSEMVVIDLTASSDEEDGGGGEGEGGGGRGGGGHDMEVEEEEEDDDEEEEEEERYLRRSSRAHLLRLAQQNRPWSDDIQATCDSEGPLSSSSSSSSSSSTIAAPDSPPLPLPPPPPPPSLFVPPIIRPSSFPNVSVSITTDNPSSSSASSAVIVDSPRPLTISLPLTSSTRSSVEKTLTSPPRPRPVSPQPPPLSTPPTTAPSSSSSSRPTSVIMQSRLHSSSRNTHSNARPTSHSHSSSQSQSHSSSQSHSHSSHRSRSRKHSHSAHHHPYATSSSSSSSSSSHSAPSRHHSSHHHHHQQRKSHHHSSSHSTSSRRTSHGGSRSSGRSNGSRLVTSASSPVPPSISSSTTAVSLGCESDTTNNSRGEGLIVSSQGLGGLSLAPYFPLHPSNGIISNPGDALFASNINYSLDENAFGNNMIRLFSLATTHQLQTNSKED